MTNLGLASEFSLSHSGAESNYCSKCGSMERLRPNYHASCHERSSEHLHFTCGWCGYDWTGETVDKLVR